VDGTHLGLAFKPELDGEDYWTWKQSYAVSAMVVCDDFKRIRCLILGWPGSVHDQRIYQNSSLNKKLNLNFALREYILGDSAFTNIPTVVPAYKKFGDQVMLTAGQTFFNCHWLIIKWNTPLAFGKVGFLFFGSFIFG
jgi:hypothetical protein